jgi:hypothetical protein
MKYKAPKQFAFIDGSGRFRRMTSAIWDDELMQACVNNIPHKAAYESVFQFPDWTGGRLTADIARSAIIDRVFIDLDDKADPLRAIRDAGKIATYLLGYTTNNFSGMKGAHVMIHCDPTDLIPDLKGSVLTRFAIELGEALDITTMDIGVTGDLNRVQRIIDSKHPGSGLYAVGLRSNELANLSMEKITSMAKQPRGLIQRPKTSKWVTEQLQLIEEEIIRERMQKLVDDHMIGHRNAYELGCLLQTDRKQEVWDFMMETEEIVRRIQMKKLENLPKTSGGRTPEETWLLKVIEIFKIVHRAANIQPAGSLIGTSASEHEARCHLVNLANDCGWTHGEIADIFSGADDYNQKVTEGQIRSIIGR